MAEDPQVQIVCVRENGNDPRTLKPFAPLSEQMLELKKLKKWPGKALRPKLELWDTSGAKIAEPAAEPTK